MPGSMLVKWAMAGAIWLPPLINDPLSFQTVSVQTEVVPWRQGLGIYTAGHRRDGKVIQFGER
jgi:hypothetical protein